MNDKQFRVLLDYLKLSWKGYRIVRKGVKKKIRRHMQQIDCRNISEYIKVLEWNSDIREQTDTLMMVTISLEQCGLLIIGSHETLPLGFENLILRHRAVYQRDL